jgi:GWxTD domain-containing protein
MEYILNNSMKKVFPILFILAILINVLKSKADEPFFFDAICFKSQIDTLSRIDIYVLVPYGSLSFFKTGDRYVAEIDLSISLKDSTGKSLKSKSYPKKIFEKEQLETIGFSGKYQVFFDSFEVREGTYSVFVSLYDKNSATTYSKSRTTNALNFSRFEFAISGLMFLSDVEELNGKYKITPFLSDNLGNLDKAFIFFETYQKTKKYDSIDIVYLIRDFKGKEIFRSSRKRYSIKDNAQLFVSFSKPANLGQGTYNIRVVALKPGASYDSLFKDNEILSIAERGFEFSPSIMNLVLSNLDKSIRQLKYVAYQSDIDYINEAKTYEEKLNRFLEFWKKLDPTPSTEFNEAFEEYYQRIYYANTAFKSYMEGWQTDRGMVYVVLGPPATIQTQTDFAYNRSYEIWNYSNRTFIFVDYSGFGDYRLYSPPSFSEKYSYKP